MNITAPVLSKEEKVALNYFGATLIPCIMSETSTDYQWLVHTSKDINPTIKSSQPTITAKNKFYIAGKHSLTLSQIRTMVKALDGVVTSDLSKADYILGEDIDYSVDLDYIYTVKNIKLTSRLDTYYTRKHLADIYGLDRSEWDVDGSTGYFYKLSDLIDLYSLMTNTLQVIGDEDLSELANLKVSVTSELLDQIIKMFKGGDEDKTLAQEMLLGLDFTDDHYELYRLSKEVSEWYFNKRSKRMRRFLETTDYYNLSALDSEDYLKYLERKNMLYPKAVYLLEQSIRKRVRVHNAWMYKFTFEIKDEYKDYIRAYQKQLNDETSQINN